MKFSEYKKIVHEPKLEKMQGDLIYRTERNISAAISYILVKISSFLRPNHITSLSILILFVVLISNFIDLNINLSALAIIQLILLYSITILDKIDGEIARARNFYTKKGMFYDRFVHSIYPLILYFTISWGFYIRTGNGAYLALGIILAILTSRLDEFIATKTFILKKAEELNVDFKDLRPSIKKEKFRPPLPLRIVHYTTFMIYAWTIFYYLFVFSVSFWSLETSIVLFLVHIILSICVVGYKVLFLYPNSNL